MAHMNVNFISATLKRAVSFDIIIPSVSANEIGPYNNGEIKYCGSNKYPVLYLLHGSFNDCKSWQAYTSVERYAEERNIAVVLVSGENKSFLNIRDELYEDFLENELQDFVKFNFPISDRWEDTYIAGLSMGGFGALYHALKYSEKYMAVGAFSPGIIDDIKSKKNPINLTRMLEEDVMNGIDVPWMYITVGSKDPILEEDKPFIQKMKKLHIEGYFKIVPGYDHEWEFWDLELRYFLDMIPRNDPYKNSKRRI